MDAFIGEVRIFTGNFAPRGWAVCAGQLLPISQNTALFALLGTTYGGDGRVSFALPDLRGRVPIHPNGAYLQGDMGGAEKVPTEGTGTVAHSSAAGVRGDSPDSNMMPFVAVNFIICMQGIFPARNR